MPRNEKFRKLLYFLLISIFLHISVIFVFRINREGNTLEKEILTSQRVVLVVRELPEEITKRINRRQVVNNELTGAEVFSKTSKFYGKKNQVYKVETVPKEIGQFRERKAESRPETRAEKFKSGNLKMADLLVPKPKDIEEFATKKMAHHRTFYAGIVVDNEARNNDYIEDVKLGDATNLNTQEYKFWGFYNRIRTSLEPNWEKLLDERVRRYFIHGKRLILTNRTMTLIKITLDEEGNVFRMKVLASSGIAEIDNIAIDAITMSGPFVSVPREMLKDKLVEIEWGFVVNP